MTSATKRKRPLTLADITAEQREHLELCVHEAGHSVASVALGGVIRSAVVASGRVIGIEGLTRLDDMPTGRDAEIAYAGPYSQARWSAGRRPTMRQFCAALDNHGQQDYRALTASGGTHTGADIVPLIERCWPAVLRVAQHLHRTGEARQSHVLAALGITDGGGAGSAQLAGLRAGLRSVPPIELKTRAVPA